MAEKNNERAAEKTGSGRGRFMVLALSGLLLLAGAGGAGAYFLGLFGIASLLAPAQAAQPAAGDDAVAAREGAGGIPALPSVIFVDLPDVLVNLNADARRMRFLKLNLAVEVSSQSVADSVQQLTPRIMDSFQLYLRGLTVEDLSGPGALHRLKQEMLARINLALDPGRIDDVLFKEILVQ